MGVVAHDADAVRCVLVRLGEGFGLCWDVVVGQETDGLDGSFVYILMSICRIGSHDESGGVRLRRSPVGRCWQAVIGQPYCDFNLRPELRGSGKFGFDAQFIEAVGECNWLSLRLWERR